MKRGLWILVMLLGCSLYGCSAGRETENTAEASGLPRFEADMETVERLPVPDGLPEELCPYEAWTRETEWALLSELENGSDEGEAAGEAAAFGNGPKPGIYANREDQSGLYILWKEEWLRTEWEEARGMEAGLKTAAWDFDQDGEEELAVALCPPGGAHWAREEPHILGQDREGEWQDAAFPLQAYEDWILENTRILPEGRLTFLDASLELEVPEQDSAAAGEYELADTISLITVELEGNEIVTEAVLDPEDIASGKSLAVVRTSLYWDGTGFQILDYELNTWESGNEIQQ